MREYLQLVVHRLPPHQDMMSTHSIMRKLEGPDPRNKHVIKKVVRANCTARGGAVVCSIPDDYRWSDHCVSPGGYSSKDHYWQQFKGQSQNSESAPFRAVNQAIL
ncbi:hypothetical protein XENOCAPTIV_030366 [Xenoophorus captivus]|uniref:Uncharacterized protein n=1 Tax=Xenoophorus captivus TaxID=1517983 RepID=A0ABV0QFC9_9TELE